MRTRNLYGQASPQYVQVLEQIADRAAHHRDYRSALTALDEAIETVRAHERAGVLPYLVRRRGEIERQAEHN